MTRAYRGALDPRLLEEMTAVEMLKSVQTNTGMTEEEQMRSCTIYYMQTMLVEGRAQSMVTNCPVGCGYELWRRLVQAYEPKVASRSQGILVQILMYDFDMSDFLASLERWETLLRQYDGAVASAAERVQDSVKTATVISRIAKGPLHDHLMLNAAKYTKYDDMRGEIAEILRAQRFMLRPSGVQNSGPSPMEIGVLAKGRGKKGDGRQCYAVESTVTYPPSAGPK